MSELATFLRYPGSKRRMLDFLLKHLPARSDIKGKFVEPFVGGGAVYFAVAPRAAVLSDINRELIDIYLGIAKSPERVWYWYRRFPTNKSGYRSVRDTSTARLSICQRAARSLFLSRTCFKGMWRHNLQGKFNVGYGGQERRWAIKRRDLYDISRILSSAKLACSDFEPVIDECCSKDFIFLDPPYRPGEREQIHDHYAARRFRFEDHVRLASGLRAADKRRVAWAITISDHPTILRLYKGFKSIPIPSGTSRLIGVRNAKSGEVLISNV